MIQTFSSLCSICPAEHSSPRKKRRLSEMDTNLLHTLLPGNLHEVSNKLTYKDVPGKWRFKWAEFQQCRRLLGPLLQMWRVYHHLSRLSKSLARVSLYYLLADGCATWKKSNAVAIKTARRMPLSTNGSFTVSAAIQQMDVQLLQAVETNTPS